MLILRKILLVFAILVGLLLLGLWDQGDRERRQAREGEIMSPALDWFRRMADDQTSETLDLCGYPFDANGAERAATREDLERILPRYVTAADWPWTVPRFALMKFHHDFADPDEQEKKNLAPGTRVVVAWIENRTNRARIYVQPDPSTKVVGFRVSKVEEE
jgi:hypothetical protein